MLFLIILVLLFAMIGIVFVERDKLSIWIAGMDIGLILVILAYTIIWIKNGGISRQISYVLYFSDGMKKVIQYFPISYPGLSKLLLFGKSLFLCFMMFVSIHIVEPIGSVKKVFLETIAVVVAIFNYGILHPNIYEWHCNMPFFKEHQSFFFHLVRLLYVMYLFGCLIMVAKKYSAIKINWVKRQFQHSYIFIFNVSVLFVIFAVLGPIQVSHFTGSHYIYSNFLYFNSQWIWLVIVICSVVSIFAGTRALWMYSRLAKKIGRPDIAIDKKLKTHNAGVKMYTHGMKNELLVLRAMLRDFGEEIELDEIGKEKLASITAVSESMLLRMDDLYHAFKNNAMVLEGVEKPSDIVATAICKMGTSFEDICLEISEEAPILADSHYLSEAIYNLIKNSVDSIEQKGGEGQVYIRLYIQGADQIFEVSDTGEGIPEKNIRKIFEPFYSSKNSKKNWGIGLLYVEQIVRGHFGEISVESVVGKGTQMYVSIPLYKRT